MSFVVEAQIHIDVAPEVAFDKLLDYPTWKEWMPRSFAPASPAQGPHEVGRRFRVRIAHAPVSSLIEMTVADRPREITWCGGRRGVLFGEHHFYFSDDGKGGTEVRSSETWSGVLAPVLRPLLQRAAKRVGRQQLGGLAKACRV